MLCNTTQNGNCERLSPQGARSGEFLEHPHWGSSPSSGYGVIEPTGHVQAIYIAVPGAASAYRLYSVDRENWTPISDKGEGRPGTVIVGKAHGDDAPCWLLFSFGESGTTRPTKGRLAGSFFYSVNQRKSCPPNWVDAVQYNPEWHL